MPDTLADQHQAIRAGFAAITSEQLIRMWGSIDPQNIARSWNAQVHDAADFVSEMQVAAAFDAEQYMDAQLLSRGHIPDGPRLEPKGFAGRSYPMGNQTAAIPLEYALMTPAFTALQSIKQGASSARGMATGLNTLVSHGATAVEDAGKAADGVALNTKSQVTGYVRKVDADPCADCSILAGRRYARNSGFARHPNCLCTHDPIMRDEKHPGIQDPYDVFGSMTTEQQDSRWGPDSAQAIRDGGDIYQVTNARRGRSADRLTTSEGTAMSRGRPRGFAGKQMERSGLRGTDSQGRGTWTTGRLTPEAIYKNANHIPAGADRDRVVQEQLNRYGYITGPQDGEPGRTNLQPSLSGWNGPSQGYWRSAGAGATYEDALREELLGNYTWNPNT